MGFIAPSYLLLLPIALFIGFYLYKQELTRVNLNKRFSLSTDLIRGRYILPTAIFVLTILAIARPYLGETTRSLPRTQRDLVIVFDISRSMRAVDVEPSRLNFARRKIYDLIDLVRTNHHGDRIALVLFAADGYLFCPLTSDYGLLKIFTDAISTDLITAQGTGILSAINTALNSLKEARSVDGRILLISDGEDSSADINKIINRANRENVKIYTLGIGTHNGAPIQLGDGSLLQDSSGNTVITKLNDQILIDLSERTGGSYSYAQLNDNDLLDVLSGTRGSLKTNDSGTKITIYNELGPFIIFFILLIIIIFTVRNKHYLTVFLLIFISSNQLHAQSPEEHYYNGDYPEALKGFKNILSNNKDSYRVIFALANTHFRLNNFHEAVKTFEKAIDISNSPREKFYGYYNLGNSFFALENYQKAVEAYDQALLIKPNDHKTSFNRDLALKKLKDQPQDRNEQTQSPTPTPEQNKNDQEEQQQDKQTPSPSPTADSNQQTNNDNKNNDQQNKDFNDPPPSSENESTNESEISEDEASAWLDSLPESPVLLRRKVGNERQNEQSW